MDDAVDLTVAGARDYIGKAKIPLNSLSETASIHGEFAIFDEKGLEGGKVRVLISLFNKENFNYGSAAGLSSHLIMQETIKKIISHQSEGHASCDMMLHVWLGSSGGVQSFTQTSLSDLFLHTLKIPGLTKNDVDVFWKGEGLDKTSGKIGFAELKKVF
jgi:hypothetical protein